MTYKEETTAILDAWGNEPPKTITVRGHHFYVRELSTAEMDRRLAANKQDWQKDLRMTAGATAVLCDPQGELLYDPQNQDDVKRIGKVPWARISKLVNAIQAEEDQETGN